MAKFEPTKTGDYLVEYRVEGRWVSETVHYDKKTDQWIGTNSPEFYKEHIRSWYF